MDERNNLIILYDYYGGLLSDKQKEYFEQYYFENLSLSEMAENLNISRNAIHKVLKNIAKITFYTVYKSLQKSKLLAIFLLSVFFIKSS